MSTPSTSKNIFGDELYQIRAQKAFPILVRQAELADTIYYSEIAAELGMSNPRNMNYVLGSVGVTLQELAKEWGEEIPALQALVINVEDELPGEGIGEFFTTEDYKKLTKPKKKALVKGVLGEILAYRYWREVLAELDLKPLRQNHAKAIAAAEHLGRDGIGESEEHKRLKRYIFENPQLLGLKAKTIRREEEHNLPSGDKIDVYFCVRKREFAVEVKSRRSNDDDLVRGMFQCVKYAAVIEARQKAAGYIDEVQAVLVSERPLPEKLVSLKNSLGVRVISGISPI